jgi:hypothetical protein
VFKRYDQVSPAQLKPVSADELLSLTEHDRYCIFEGDLDNQQVDVSLFSQGRYQLVLPETLSPAVFMAHLVAMDRETEHNYIINNEQQRQFSQGLPRVRTPAQDYLPKPYETTALVALFGQVEQLRRAQVDDLGRASYQAMPLPQGLSVVKEAEYQLFDIMHSTYSGVATLGFRNEEHQLYGLQFKPEVTMAQAEKLIDALREESTQNFELSREHNPDIKAQREHAKNLPSFDEMFPPDPEMTAYMDDLLKDDIEYQQSIGNQDRVEELVAQEISENVVTPRFRR